MIALVTISVWHWVGFIGFILVFLSLDLWVFNRFARVIKPKEALLWCSIWFLFAMLFARGLAVWRTPAESLEFITGYFVEYSLSMDNVFAIALIFSYFGVEPRHQHRVLYWGIVGALVMRGLMIGLGAELILNFYWVLYILGAFLVITGIKWGFSEQEVVRPEKNLVVRWARKLFPVLPGFHDEKFFTIFNGRRALTPLALVLLMVETTDLVFAVDSVPAIFAVTQKAFIVFTSNIFAILGLRSLYFVLAGAIQYFRFLKAGLAAVLVFIGIKMLVSRWHPVPTGLSLVSILIITSLSIVLSVLAKWRERRNGGHRP
jgi:tellurite resistance protein TerC